MTSGMKKRLVRLKERLAETFGEDDWNSVALLTDQEDIIYGERRLFKAAKYKDPDYRECILSVLLKLADADESAVDEIEKYLTQHYPTNDDDSSDEDDVPTITIAPTVFSKPKRDLDSNLVSVMMPFDAGFNPVYKAIKRAVVDNHGMRCERADEIWKRDTIIQDIFELLYASRLVIVDFSGKNPNVMYETGIAHTLGIPVIPIVQSPADVPFDTQHIRYQRYLPNKEGLKTLSQKLTLRMNAILAEG